MFVRVVGGVQQILPVELAKDGVHENIADRHWVVGMSLQHGIEALHRAFIVEDVKALKALADLRIEIERVSILRV